MNLLELSKIYEDKISGRNMIPLTIILHPKDYDEVEMDFVNNYPQFHFYDGKCGHSQLKSSCIIKGSYISDEEKDSDDVYYGPVFIYLSCVAHFANMEKLRMQINKVTIEEIFPLMARQYWIG